jgi:hypothetical protein
MGHDIEKFCVSCETCQMSKSSNQLLVGSGPLLRMAGYESLCELFFMSKCYFDRVNPLEPNFLVLNNNDIHRVRSKIVKIIKIFEKLEHLKTNRP